MARGKKKDAAPATTAPENTATPEAHLDPGQFADMDDATLQGLARDMGLDPAAYEDREALIAAIAAVPVIPGPPDAEEPPTDPGPAQEPTAEPEQQQDPAPPPADPDPAPAGERPLPYKAKVAVSLAVLHKAVGVGTADMLKAVGTLRQGAEVTVTARNGPFAQLKNGLWVKESFLEA